MSRVLVFDTTTNLVAPSAMPPGEFQPHLRTAEHELCWARIHPDGSKSIVYGSLIVPENSITVLVQAPYVSDADVRTWTRPANDALIDAIFQGSQAIANLGEKEALLAAKDERMVAQQKEMDKLQKKHTTALATHKRKLQAAESSAKSAKSEADTAKTQAASLAKQHAELEEGFESYKASVASLGGSSSAGLMAIEALYKKLIEDVMGALRAKAPPPQKKKKASASAPSTTNRPPPRDQVVFEFEDDNLNWVPIQDASAIDAFAELYEAQVDAQTNGTVPHTVVKQFRMQSYAYEASWDSTAPPATAPALFAFVQHNTSTQKKRKVRCIAAPSDGDPVTQTQKQKQLTALCGPEFTHHVSKIDAERMLLQYALDGLPTTSDDAELKALLAAAGNLIAEFAHYTTKFSYSPSHCEPLLKPFQLKQALMLAATKGMNHCRFVIHGTKTGALDEIRKDPIGLDLTYCRTSCRYGKANYVATTFDAPEGQGYNGTGVPGKMLLMLLFSPHARLDTQEPSPMWAYHFCARDRINGRSIDDAIAVFGNANLLPLGIISP